MKRVGQLLLDNPALTVGGGTILFFVVARVPTEVFYARFGMRPEDIGLDSIQVLLQSATLLLLTSFAVALLYAVAVPIVFTVYFRLIVHMLRRRVSGNVRQSSARILRIAPVIVPLFAMIFAAVVLTVRAEKDASAVEAGRPISGEFVPWRAEPVSVMWNRGAPRQALPGCESLFFLGEGKGRVVLFDSQARRTERLNSADVELVFPDPCPR